MCTCGTGSYGTNQRNSKFERIPFSYVHEEFLVLFYEFSKDPKPSGTRTRSLTDSKRHWYRGEGGETPLLGREGERDGEAGEGDSEFEGEELPPTLPISDLLDALNVDPETQEKTRRETEEEQAHERELEVEAQLKRQKQIQERQQQLTKGEDNGKCYTREVDLYPFQEQVLNFDNNEDPVENLRQFLRLLRGSNRAMSGYLP